MFFLHLDVCVSNQKKCIGPFFNILFQIQNVVDDDDEIKTTTIKMNENSQASSLRRYPLVNPLIGNELETMSNSSFSSSSSSREYQQLIPINVEHVSTLGNLSSKRRRSSITSESSRPNLISTIPEDFIDQRMSSRRKRSAQDDIDAYPSPHIHRDYDRYVSETKNLIHLFILIFRRTNELVMNVLEALNSKINLHVQH